MIFDPVALKQYDNSLIKTENWLVLLPASPQRRLDHAYTRSTSSLVYLTLRHKGGLRITWPETRDLRLNGYADMAPALALANIERGMQKIVWFRPLVQRLTT
jgi:hypothetical protein